MGHNLSGHNIGRYHILEQLGEGGMATVYKAVDTRLDREVAIKFLRIEKLESEKAIKRFDLEVKALAKLNHTNIVRVLDYGEYQSSPYLVMEYIQGGSLKEMLEQPLPYGDVAAILAPIARALAYAHKKHILHRDVKPSNILIKEDGQPMLADFGVAKILTLDETLDLTGTSVGVGTPYYMAPEQGTSLTPDHRADIYSLGVVFYEMVTGRKPFQAETPMGVLVKHINDPLPRPRDYTKDLPRDVERVIIKALMKDPAKRYQTMDELVQVLGSLSQKPTPKVREKRIPKESMPWWRHWGVWAGAGIVAIVILALVYISTMETPLVTAPTETFVPTNSTPWLSNPLLSNPQITITPISMSNPTLDYEISITQVSPVDRMSMVYIPAGKFLMGSDEGTSDNQPVHEVYLDAFWMDKHEVTLGQYQQFVEETGFDTKGSGESEDHAVTDVDWYDAQAYCEWAERRLPTEAEWEKAARGGLEGKKYPWGNEDPVCISGSENGARFNDHDQCDDLGTAPVMSYAPNGYGLYDMAGNAWEWIFDWYGKDYYGTSPSENPRGPVSGNEVVLRGGSWIHDAYPLRTAHRDRNPRSEADHDVGFRCAASE